jgi:uncharacterized protein
MTDAGFFYRDFYNAFGTSFFEVTERGDDPFIGTEQQTSRLRAHVKVIVAGVDITSKILPHLISVVVIDGEQQKTAEIEIDDRDGKLPIPPYGSPVSVDLGWRSESFVRVFEGVIEDFEHGFARKQGGRRMWVHANSADMLKSKMKEPIQDMLGEGAPPGQQEGSMHGLSSWIQQFTKHAGVNAKVSGAFDAVKQDFWSAANASPMHLMNTLKDQIGFTHQWDKPGSLVVEKMGERGLSCRAIWRDNLIAWRVRPFASRPTFGGSKQQSYDAKESGWKEKLQNFGFKGPWGEAVSNAMSAIPAATESAAGQDNQGAQAGAEGSYFGNGRIIINGEPRARWNSYVDLIGARPGVDGRYLIVAAEHHYSRHGYITQLEVEPEVGGGKPSSMDTQNVWNDLPKPAPNIGGQ